MFKSTAAFLIALAGLFWLTAAQQAEARMEYNKEFWMMYAKQIGAQNGVKCIACHEGTDKKKRNLFGVAVQTKLKDKEVKDAAKIKAALEAAAKEPSAFEGKTFGDLIKEGKLPATKPE